MKKFSVLIVDDDASIRDLLKSIFSIVFGCEKIIAVSDGLAALDILKEYSFDLLVTDRRMPGMLGEELVRQTRVMYSSIKIILMSGDNPDEFEQVALDAGADRVLRKPVQLFQIEKTIGELFSS